MRGLNLSHGESGKRRTALYRAWESMRVRCSSPDRYPSYVGVTVFPAWQSSFELFRDYVNETIGPRPRGHSLDRIDNDCGYEPGNLRWATPKEQSNNRWNTTKITVDGVTRSVSEWGELHGLTIAAIRARLKYGWPEALAVTTPGRPYTTKSKPPL